jgi:ABC-type transport system involved in cytochrome c biogenesis ATPase subunit
LSLLKKLPYACDYSSHGMTSFQALLFPTGLPPGLIAITGGEGSGKTRFLRSLAGDLPTCSGEAPLPGARWLDLRLPAQDDKTPQQVWDTLRAHSPR